MFAKALMLTGGVGSGAYYLMSQKSALGLAIVHAAEKDGKSNSTSPTVSDRIASVRDTYQSGVRSVNNGLVCVHAVARSSSL
jgi:hypothetical protein